MADSLALLYPRLSPDGTRVAGSVTTGSALDLWTFDLERGSRLRLTTDHNNRRNVWSPDGRQIAFFSLPSNPPPGVSQDLYAVPSTGGAPNRLLQRPGPQWPDSWSPDGRFLVFEDGQRGASRDLWLLPLGEEPRPLVVTRFNERGAVFSPDGRWLAFVTDESGRAGGLRPAVPRPRPENPCVDKRRTAAGVVARRSRAVLPRRRLADGRACSARSVSCLGSRESSSTCPARSTTSTSSSPTTTWRLTVAFWRFARTPRTEIHVVLNWTVEVQRALAR